MINSTEAFSLAFKKLVDELGRGGQTKVAKSIGYERVYFNKLYRGVRPAPLNFQEKVAEYFDMPLHEMVRLGHSIEQDKTFIPDMSHLVGLDKKEQAKSIKNIVDKETGVDDLLSALVPKSFDDFVNNKIDMGAYYLAYRDEVITLKTSIKKL